MNIRFFFRKDRIKKKFTNIFYNNSFNGTASVSGSGSDLTQTQTIRIEIPKLLKKHNVNTFIDAPCGDFYWMQHIELDGI
jgi:hypothetical protein